MNETLAIEAVRAAGGLPNLQMPTVAPTADPNAVAAFSDAMGTQDVTAPTGVPFADAIQRNWQASESMHQQHLHRIAALTEMGSARGLSALQLSAIQYEVAAAGFDLEVTTIVAKKASDAITTLVKNG